MSKQLKAWIIFECDPHEGCALVFAETRSRAKVLGFSTGFFDEYIYLSANRRSAWDEYATEEKIIESNDELPEGAPTFFSDMEI